MFVCPQMFIVIILIIGNTQNVIFILQWKERGNRRGAGETERECVRDRAQLKIELASVVIMAVGERLTILG